MSKAFCSIGTKLFIDGETVDEVTMIEVGRKLEVKANYIPSSIGQRLVLAAILAHRTVEIEISTPDELHTSMYFVGRINGVIRFVPEFLPTVVTIEFEMELAAKDPADDGPEVEIIQREQFNRIWEQFNRIWERVEEDLQFDAILRNYFAAEYIEKAGGRFIIVHERN